MPRQRTCMLRHEMLKMISSVPSTRHTHPCPAFSPDMMVVNRKDAYKVKNDQITRSFMAIVPCMWKQMAKQCWNGGQLKSIAGKKTRERHPILAHKTVNRKRNVTIRSSCGETLTFKTTGVSCRRLSSSTR